MKKSGASFSFWGFFKIAAGAGQWYKVIMNGKIKLFRGGKFDEAKFKGELKELITRTFAESVSIRTNVSPEILSMKGEYSIKVKNIDYSYIFTLEIESAKKGRFLEEKIFRKKEGDGFYTSSVNTTRATDFQPWVIENGKCDNKYFKNRPPSANTAADFLCGKIHESCVNFMDSVAKMDVNLLAKANNKLKNSEVRIDNVFFGCAY